MINSKTKKKKLYPLIEKAYEIDLDKLEEGFLSSGYICHAVNRNEARVKLLHEVRYDDWKLRYTGEELTYLNIPIRRVKFADKVLFEGNVVSRWRIQEILDERERFANLDKLLDDPTVEYCYIYKGGYYRPNNCGYTSLRHEVGVYNKREAVSSAKSCREIRLIPVNKEDHNQMLKERIKEYQDKLL